MKVLHVIPSVSDKHGGPSGAVRLFVHASRLTGDDATIATTDDDGDNSRFDLPLGYGGWRKKSLQELADWMTKGEAAVEKSLIVAANWL